MSEDDGKAVKKTVLLYPEEKAGDRIALDFINEGMLKERGRIMRAMLLTGAAMMQANKKLPFMIAELFDENTTFTDIQRVIRSAIPEASAVDDDMLRDVLSRLGAMPAATHEEKGGASAPASEPTQEERNQAEARRNASKMFGVDD
ncbi:MAG: plasmid partitioning/stability family protein [Pantoea sp.]|uniref:plasmid partitioning/stability family protein n=1 Tax=Erwiniaceae TaxID=1903409 RepID=UPI002897838A|nr:MULTISPECIES: plasmid partitioning/stability family protein [Pantoea]MDU5836265.1 plasmid partitioning/stability family protein [Pantoea sp.]MDU6438361.1 plasmid partitioning/stability family protein [Pantoea sp.]